MSKLAYAACILVLAAWATGCVKKSDYDAKVAQLGMCDHGAQQCRLELQRSVQKAGELDKQGAELRKQLEDRTAQANHDLGELQKQLDDSTALASSLKQELARTGADVDKLMREKGSLSSNLEQARKRLEELRKAEQAAQKRAQELRNLIDRFKKMADAGQLKVGVRKGRLMLLLPNDVLFDSGRADVKTSGQATLAEVGRILSSMQDRQFQVAGHTDNNPISTQRFPNNWYLSTARATEVLQVLLKHGMQPTTLSAVGYGEFDPVAPNDTDENRARNRRIEITVQPNVEELLEN
jgi:chemotaxis protein MotB